jgi:RNA polymerase sigma factor (sigma-70 family)
VDLGEACIDAGLTADLVKRAATGDSAAWSQLVDRFAGLVWSTATGYGLSQASAEDVTQTACLRLVEHLDRLENPEHLGSWLATTAKRECLRVLRSRVREVLRDAMDDAMLVDQVAPRPALPARLSVAQ